jgi:hypothetical protein
MRMTGDPGVNTKAMEGMVGGALLTLSRQHL